MRDQHIHDMGLAFDLSTLRDRRRAMKLLAGVGGLFPAAYSGPWPHIHFEVYPSLDQATAARSRVATSQLALPKDACDSVYATTGYEASIRNLARTSLARDNVFRDGSSRQLATMAGSVAAGYTAELSVPV